MSDTDRLVAGLSRANRAFMADRPGDSGERQPVHTVYGGAHLFRRDSAARLGAVALGALRELAPNSRALGAATGVRSVKLAGLVHRRVVEKLEREPIEDFRIDFEDGYGNRPDAEEDAEARRCGEEIAAGLEAGSLPPFIGIRIKPLSEELRVRSLRTLYLVLTALARRTGGRLPPGFVVTLPKITIVEQVTAFAGVLASLEQKLKLREGALRFELMVETPQSILGPDGACPLAAWVAAGEGRVRGAHFGTYDYTASLNITAAHQRMRHPACDFAKQTMQVALAGTGVWLSDGSTTILPVAPHRGGEDAKLTAAQKRANRSVVHRAWRLHFDDVMASLAGGFYQGWDLHPAQLVTRYAALFTFFLSGLDAAGVRLRNFVERAAQATLVGDVFDDAATGQGLLAYFLRGINSGAITEKEAVEMTGVTLDELRGRSFVKILKNRSKRGA